MTVPNALPIRVTSRKAALYRAALLVLKSVTRTDRCLGGAFNVPIYAPYHREEQYEGGKGEPAANIAAPYVLSSRALAGVA